MCYESLYQILRETYLPRAEKWQLSLSCPTGGHIINDIIGISPLIMTFLLANKDSAILISQGFRLKIAAAKKL